MDDRSPLYYASQQLDLWEDEVSAMPWRGLNPRDLTRVGMSLFLRQGRQKHERLDIDPAQIDMFDAAYKKGPPRRGGSPLLVEPGGS